MIMKTLRGERRMVPLGAVTVMFGVLVVALILLGWRNEEINRKSIARHEDSITRIDQAYRALSGGIRANCAARNRNVSRFNAALDAAATAGVTDPKAHADELARVLPFKLVMDDCSRYP